MTFANIIHFYKRLYVPLAIYTNIKSLLPEEIL